MVDRCDKVGDNREDLRNFHDLDIPSEARQVATVIKIVCCLMCVVRHARRKSNSFPERPGFEERIGCFFELCVYATSWKSSQVWAPGEEETKWTKCHGGRRLLMLMIRRVWSSVHNVHVASAVVWETERMATTNGTGTRKCLRVELFAETWDYIRSGWGQT